MRVVFFLLVIFLSFEVRAARCEAHLGPNEGHFVSLTAEEGRRVLRTFGIMNPQLVTKFHENSKYQQIDLITNLSLNLQTLHMHYNQRVLDKSIIQQFLLAHENVITIFLSYKILNRQPIDLNTYLYIEKLAKVHLEIKARYAALDDVKPSTRQLPRRSLLLLRFIVINSYLVEQAENRLKLN